MTRGRPVVLALSLIAVVLALTLSACGGSSDSNSTSTASESNSTGESGGDEASSVVTAAENDLEPISGAKGTFKPPVTGGPKATPGKSVYVVTYGLGIAYFAAQTKAVKEAAGKLGWQLNVWDGKFESTEWLAGIRQAVTAKADGIILEGPDCATVKAGLEAAKGAGIPVVAILAFDCNEGEAGGEPLFTWAVTHSEGSIQEYMEAVGEAQANWAIRQTNGEAKILSFEETDALAFRAIQEGFEKGLEKCEGCEVLETVQIVGTDYGPALQQKAQQALLKNPDATIVYPAGAEAPLDGGIAAALRTSASKPISTSANGGPNAGEYIEQGIAGMTISTAPNWEGWAAMDGLVKLFAGEEPPQDTGIGLRLIDEENLDSFAPYKPPVEFEAAYEESWGVD